MDWTTVTTGDILQVSHNHSYVHTNSTNGTKGSEDYYDILDYTDSSGVYTAALTMVKLLFPALVVIGTVTNTLVIVLLRRGTITTDNLSFFLSVLAAVDTVFLYTSGLKTWVRVVWGFELLHLGSWSCKLGLFLNQLCMTLSAWLVVVVAWQRWYTCSRPFDRCCPVDNRVFSYLALTVLFLLLVGANSYVLVTAELHQDQWGRHCAPGSEYDHVISHAFFVVLLLLYSVLPALLLILTNGLLARVLFVSRRSLLTHTDSVRSGSRDDRQVRARYNHLTALLMALSLSWLLLTTPHTLLKITETLPDSLQDKATQTFLNVLFFVLLYINHCINFFLYCALIRSFRRAVCRLSSKSLCCLKTLLHGCHLHFLAPCFPHDSSLHSHNTNTDSFVPLIQLYSGRDPLPGDAERPRCVQDKV